MNPVLSGENPPRGSIPAVVTAGGRLQGELAEKTGVRLKALLPCGGRTLLEVSIRALRDVPAVGRILVVGPEPQIAEVAREAGADRVLNEGATGPENLALGLKATGTGEGERALFAASDLPFLSADAVAGFLEKAATLPADIIYPIVSRTGFEAAYPGVAKTYARLAGTDYTGGSVLLLEPNAILRNLPLIEQLFAARKSQWGMARLLGFVPTVRFALGKLTVRQAEARASELTGCRCLALHEADPRLSYDVDDLQDYGYALRRLTPSPAPAPETGRNREDTV